MHRIESVQPSRAGTRPVGTRTAGWQGAAADPLADTPVEFDIPAGPLGASLLAIAQNVGTLVSFKPELVSRHQAPAIQGRFTLPQALRLALQPSGLSFQVMPSGVVTIVGQAGAAEAPTRA